MEAVDGPAGEVDVGKRAHLGQGRDLVLRVGQQGVDQRGKAGALDGGFVGRPGDPDDRRDQPGRVRHLADGGLHQQRGDRLVLQRHGLQRRDQGRVVGDAVDGAAEAPRLFEQRPALEGVEHKGQPLVGFLAPQLRHQPPFGIAGAAGFRHGPARPRQQFR